MRCVWLRASVSSAIGESAARISTPWTASAVANGPTQFDGALGVDVAEQLGVGGHAFPERIGEEGELAIAETQAGETRMRESDVEPRRLRRRRFAAAPCPRAAEELVEREHLFRRSRLVHDRRKPAPGVPGVAEAEEEKALVVLVEAGQHVALDVVEVDVRVARRGAFVVPGSTMFARVRDFVTRRVVKSQPRW